VPPYARPEHLTLLPAGVEPRRLPPHAPLSGSLGRGEIVVPSFDFALMRDAIPRIEGLRLIQTMSAGVDWILPAVPDGVVLCDAAGVHDISVAEWVVAVILAVWRRLPQYRDQQRDARWERPSTEDAGDELDGASVLILGYGSIGRATERRLSPFGVEVVRVARRRRDGVHAVDRLATLLPDVDIVVVLLPLTAETQNLVDARFLARMRPGALLVNAARGGVVDTAALVDAAGNGRIRVALDVVDPEPLAPDHPLWRMPGVLITPHVAGATSRFRERAWRLVADQARRYLAGEPLRNVVSDGY